jgi:5-methylcytosine-specific restriction endonuclease McrA
MTIANPRSMPWREWYGLGRWRNRRKVQLQEHPLCAFCLKRGLVVPATIVDHVEPHRGDWNKFVLGAVQSLCSHCHESTKKEIEQRGFARDVGLDGWPIDPNHPANQPRSAVNKNDHQ